MLLVVVDKLFIRAGSCAKSTTWRTRNLYVEVALLQNLLAEVHVQGRQLEYNRKGVWEHVVSNVPDDTDSYLVNEIVLEDLKGFSTSPGAQPVLKKSQAW